MKSKTTRVVLDILLVGMLVFEMFYTLTGNALHEVVGALFFVTLIVHMVFGRRFIGGLRTKAASVQGLSGKQKAMSVIMIALLVVAALLLASSILISNILTSATGWMLPATAYSLVAFLHMVSAYIVCGVTIVHIGLHWISLFKAFKIPYSPARRSAINTGVTAVAALGVIAVGAVASKEIAGWGVLDQMLGGTAQAKEGERSASGNESANLGNGDTGTNAAPQASDPSASPTGRGGNKRGEGSGAQNSSSTPQYSAPSAPESSQGDSSSNGGSSSGNGGSTGSGSSSTASGYCTLCHKRCSLSAPQCNKPYQAGLL